MGQPKSVKYNNAVSLYQAGMSVGECAIFYEITRQAMHKILRRRGCIFRNSLRNGEGNHFHRGVSPDNTKKKRCQHLVEKAIKKGVLINPNKCQTCGEASIFSDGRNGVQAHHCDYDKPLEVDWLCQKCHHEWHKNNKAINQYENECNLDR